MDFVKTPLPGEMLRLSLEMMLTQGAVAGCAMLGCC